MEGIKRIATALIGLFVSFASLGQQNDVIPYPDTLRVKTDDKNLIVLAIKDIRDETLELNDGLWKSILVIMESSLQSSSRSVGVRISYEKVEVNFEEKVKIQVTDLDESDVFWIDGEGLTHNQSDRIEFEITLPKIKIMFTLNDLTELERVKEVSIESVWNTTRDKVDTKRVLYNGTMSYESGVLKVGQINHTDRKDFLEYRLGMGMGYYLNQFVPSFSTDLSYTSLDRFGNPKTKFGLLYTQHFFSSEGAERRLQLERNAFLSFYFATTFGAKEYGMGVGYLVDQEGDFFSGPTYVLSAYTRSRTRKSNVIRRRNNSRVGNIATTSITPELIITNDFETIYPALRFGLSF